MKAQLFWKVLGYFAVLLFALVVSTFLILQILSQIETHFMHASSNSEQLNELQNLNKFISEVPALTNDYLYTGNDSIRQLYDDAWKQFDGIVAEIQSRTTDTSTAGALEIVRSSYYLWITEIGEKKMLLHEEYAERKNIQHTLDSLTRLDVRTHHLTTARDRLHFLIGDIITSQPATIQLAQNLTKALGTNIIFINLLFALFAVVLGLLLTRSITIPVKLLTEGTRKIMEGNFEPITLNRRDELGELAVDFNKMSMLLGNNYTRLNAYSELVTALNSREGIAEIESKSLNLLCQHSNASVGALYLSDDNYQTLSLVAGHGLKSEARLKKFAFGEGLPGQCAVERKVLEISEIRFGTDFIVDTGLVEIVPQNIIASPIFFRENVIGVLVMGSLSRFSELDKEIISNSLPQLGIAIANAKNYEETQKLSHEISSKNIELNAKNSELEKAYRVKSDFLASMSHELRTPLNSIIGFSSVLLGHGGDPLTEDQRKAVEKVLKNGRHLLQLINDILDFSKLESGRMTVNVEVDEVADVIAGSVMTVEAMAKGKNIEIVQRIPEGLPVLQTDILKIKQILVNLLSNAVKFTEEGNISISVAQKNSFITFAVTDSGIGIEEKNLHKIFEEFQQIDSSNTRKYKGSGLGLPISRRLAKLLGGDLTVESVYGKGSTFLLMIPIVYKDSVHANLEEEGTITLEAAEPATIAPQYEDRKREVSGDTMLETMTKGPLVLCIDDDPEVTELLKKYIVPEGFSVVEANSGDDGIAKAEAMLPSIITLDIMMPSKDGWQVLRELKQNPKTREIPVVIHSIIENRPLAFSLGAVGVLTKPTDSNELITILRREVNSKERYVLLVDDNEDFLSAAEKIVKGEGYVVKTATSGFKALEILQESTPAVIFSDLMMPEMDGFQFIQRLRNNDRWRNIPVVVLSGKDLSIKERRILKSRITDYLRKSEFSAELLTAALKRILNKT